MPYLLNGLHRLLNGSTRLSIGRVRVGDFVTCFVDQLTRHDPFNTPFLIKLIQHDPLPPLSLTIATLILDQAHLPYLILLKPGRNLNYISLAGNYSWTFSMIDQTPSLTCNYGIPLNIVCIACFLKLQIPSLFQISNRRDSLLISNEISSHDFFILIPLKHMITSN